MTRFLLPVTLLASLASGYAIADGDKCNVPKAEWQPSEVLEAKLLGEGWTVKRIKEDDGCYEVYGSTPDGKRAETYFDPKTFAIVKSDLKD